MTLSRILFGLLVLLTPAMVTAEELIPWMDDLDQAFSKAQQENKLVLIHFWHEQCAPCRKLESFVFKDGKIAAAIDRDYVAVKVNTRKNPALAKRYKIKSVPQDLVYRSDGEILSQRISPSNSRGYMFMLSQTVKSARGKQGGVDVAVVRAVNGNEPSGIPVVQGQPQSTPPSGATGFRSGHRVSDQPVDQIDPSAQAGPATQGSLPTVSVPTQVVDNPFVGERGAKNIPANTSFDPLKIKNVNTVAIVNYDQNAETTTVRQAEVRVEGDPQPAAVEPDSPTSDTTVESAQPGQTESPSGDAAQTQETLGPDSPEASLPPLGLEGFCPIALIENKEWKEGDRQFGCIHRGQLYLFLSLEARDQFLESPDRYAPVLSGFDPVVFTEQGELVAGSREHGRFIDDRIVLFTNEASFQKFKEAPMQYIDAVRQAMQESEQVAR